MNPLERSGAEISADITRLLECLPLPSPAPRSRTSDCAVNRQLRTRHTLDKVLEVLEVSVPAAATASATNDFNFS